MATSAAESRMIPSQLRIHKWLGDIDVKLARMYEGGLRVLQDTLNPDRIAQSANSIRHITYALSNSGKRLLTKSEEQDGKKAQSSNSLQLEKLFDPLGGTRKILAWTVYDRWDKEFHQKFVKISHYEREITDEQYRTTLSQYEEFLLAYVLPLQTEVYAQLDEQLRDGPTSANPDSLRLLLSRNLESYRYFCRNADSRWLVFLRESGLLVATPDSAEYLSRIAADDGEAVMGVIEPMATRTEDWATRKGLLEAAVKMPPNISRRIISKMREEGWLDTPYKDWLAHIATGLLRRLIASGCHLDGLKLAALVVDAGTREEAKEFYLKEFLDCLSEVPVAELPPFIRVLVNALGSLIRLEDPDAQEDASLVWRPAIEDHDQNSDFGRLKCLLVVSLREALERYAGYLACAGCADADGVFINLLSWARPYSIFARLRLHCYRRHGELFSEATERAALEFFHQTSTWHEYVLLLRERFGLFSEAARREWLSLLDSGPPGDHEADYVRHWKANRLAAVSCHLRPNEGETYRELLETADSIPHPDFLVFHGALWTGPTSPVTADELASMSLDAIIFYLESWAPSGDWFSPSFDGLGRHLGNVVPHRGELFSREALRFFSPKIRPVYVYHLLSGLREALRSKAALDWAGILALLDRLIDRAELDELPVLTPTGDERGWETTWTAPLQESIALLRLGLESNSWHWEHRGRIWRIIQFLCRHPDPSPEYEQQYGGDNMDPFTMSINTVRGLSFHALVQYAFWCDRQLKTKGENGSRIPAECKAVLEAHLDPRVEPSLTVRSVYGHFWSWLMFLDKTWTGALTDRLFPIEDRERKRSAWEAYVVNDFVRGSYVALRPYYERAISEVRRTRQEKPRRRDPFMGLISHIMAGYIYRVDDGDDSICAKFFRETNAAQRGVAVGFTGRAYVLRDRDTFGGNPPDLDRLQEFWSWRLGASTDPEELQEFGWWAAEGVFDDQWMLERLIETLRRAGFSNDAGIHVLRTLAGLAPKYPGPCAEALLLIVRSRQTDRWLLGFGDGVESVVAAAHRSGVESVRELAIKLVDELTKLGFEQYRGITEGSPMG